MKPTITTFPRDDEPLSHDKLGRVLFEYFFKDLIEIVRPDLDVLMDWSTLQFLPREQFENFTRSGSRIPDLVAEARLSNGDEQFFLLNVEIEARYQSKKKMERRLWESTSHLTAAHQRNVAAVVIYLRRGRPGVTIERAEEHLGKLVCWSFDYVSLGLSRALAEEWLQRPQPLAAALAAWMRSEQLDDVERKLLCMEKIATSEIDDHGRYLLANTVETYVQLTDEDEERYRTHLESEKEEVRKMVITLDDAFDYYHEKGRNVGLAEGLAIGEKEVERREEQARLAATREAVLLLLQERTDFSVPGDAAQQLDKIDDAKRLHEILSRALRAATFDELLA